MVSFKCLEGQWICLKYEKDIKVLSGEQKNTCFSLWIYHSVDDSGTVVATAPIKSFTTCGIVKNKVLEPPNKLVCCHIYWLTAKEQEYSWLDSWVN